MNDAPVSDLLIQAIIDTYNRLMAFYDCIWQYFPYTGRSTGAYNIFYHNGPIYYGAHVSGPFAQSSS